MQKTSRNFYSQGEPNYPQEDSGGICENDKPAGPYQQRGV
jgi:hypothetical protein